MDSAIASRTTDIKRFRPSVRRRLLGYLLAPLTLMLVIGVAIDHHSIVSPIYAAFDRSLSRAVLAVAAQIHRQPGGQFDIMLPDHPPPPLRALPEERFFYRVSNEQGATLAGSPDLPVVPAIHNDEFAYQDADYHGMGLRLVSYRLVEAGERLVITVGETPHRRNRAVHQMDLSFGVNDSVQMLLVFGIALFGISVALRPLQRLRDQITGRPAHILTALPTEQVPSEVLPLVDSLNTLLATVRESALSQQHFLANAAHQLRTPLTGLKAQLEVLVRETSGTPLQSRIDQLHGGIDRLAHTANQLLALARAEPSAHGSSHFLPVDLSNLVAEVIGASLDRALAYDIDLGADCQPAEVSGVYWVLHELLTNLVDNAIRYTPPGGHITLRCGVAQGQPFLEVDDTGSGIPPEERERVKERFYRGQNSGGDSCGLGLSIVDESARAHGATFSILDGGCGRGTRMRIDFPAMESDTRRPSSRDALNPST
ncbi:sensor histidine kinase [Dyella koreensis]|uniref:histidine kinase n=1 Tax=Dyella koreensis TaxID=311235 RepID=A0ABW8JZ50_9GAMM